MKKGDTVRIIGKNGHSFELGSVVTFTGETRPVAGSSKEVWHHFRQYSTGHTQYVLPKDFEEIKMKKKINLENISLKNGTKEQIKAIVALSKEKGIVPYHRNYLNGFDSAGGRIITDKWTLIFEDGHWIQGSIGWGVPKTFEEIMFILLGVNQPKEVKLNNDYTAIIDGDDVTVGCQTFPLSKVREIISVAEAE